MPREVPPPGRRGEISNKHILTLLTITSNIRPRQRRFVKKPKTLTTQKKSIPHFSRLSPRNTETGLNHNLISHVGTYPISTGVLLWGWGQEVFTASLQFCAAKNSNRGAMLMLTCVSCQRRLSSSFENPAEVHILLSPQPRKEYINNIYYHTPLHCPETWPSQLWQHRLLMRIRV